MVAETVGSSHLRTQNGEQAEKSLSSQTAVPTDILPTARPQLLQKVTFPKSSTSYGPSNQTEESMGPDLVQPPDHVRAGNQVL